MSPEPSAEPQNSAVGPVGHVADPATSPAFVLVGSDGGVVAANEVFNRLVGADVISAAAVGSAVADIVGGTQDLLGLAVDGRRGQRLDTRVEAVLDTHNRRLALIEIQIPRPADGRDAVIDWFARFADDSVAIVWLKDLDGRYVYVNRRYSTELSVKPERVLGRTDADLSQLEAIDGPRLKGSVRGGLTLGTPAAEPLSLEYTIPGFDRRPAYAALRFPLRDGAGEPLVLCGVASPADHGEIARRECGHLLEVARWYGGDARQLRRGAMEAWGITAVRPPGSLTSTSPLERELTRGAARAESPARAAETDGTRAVLEERIIALQAEVAAERRRTADLEGSLSDARGRADALAASLDAATERHQAEIGHLREQYAALLAEHRGLTAQLAAVRGRTSERGWDLSAQRSLTNALGGCLNLRSILTEAVRLVGTGGGWDIAVAWLPHEEDGTFSCAATWVRSPVDMARLETSMWQERPSANASAIGASAASREIAWIDDSGAGGDPHLALLQAEGVTSVVLVPVSHQDQVCAVLELCSASSVQQSAQAVAALWSVEAEISAANQRLIDPASSNLWGRRRR